MMLNILRTRNMDKFMSGKRGLVISSAAYYNLESPNFRMPVIHSTSQSVCDYMR